MVRGKNVGTPHADSRHFTTSSQKMDSFVSKIELVVGRHKGTHLREFRDHLRGEKGKTDPMNGNQFEQIAHEVVKLKHLMDQLEAENRELRQQLADLRAGRGIFVDIA